MRCPGQDSRYWKPGAIFEAPCPQCGSPIEFFKDEASRRCKKCGHKALNPKMDFGCATYCPYAEQCLGDLPPELIAQRKDLLKDRVAIEMKHYFQRDFKRIGHAIKVARYAEQMVPEERADPAAVIMAAYLHDIGILEAERKHGSTAGRFQEIEGPPIARAILEKLGVSAPLIEEVCDMIGHHHHPRAEETTNFKVLYDADLIVNLEEEKEEGRIDPKKMESLIEGKFLTEAGRKLARRIFSGFFSGANRSPQIQ